MQNSSPSGWRRKVGERPEADSEPNPGNPRRDSRIEHHKLQEAEERKDAASTREDAAAGSRASVITPGRPAITVPRRACACLDCRPDLYLQTIHAHELRRFNRTTHLLGLFQHDCLQLAELTIGSFNGTAGIKQSGGGAVQCRGPGLLSFAQHHAMQGWETWLRDPGIRPWCGLVDLSNYDPNALLFTPISAFNQLFFLGQLPVLADPLISDADSRGNTRAKDMLRIRWSPPGTQRRAHSHTICRDEDNSILTIVWINPHHPSHFLNPRGLINTLLHELCHASLQRYSCYNGDREGCDSNQVCVELC